jgi:hypothetical protein
VGKLSDAGLLGVAYSNVLSEGLARPTRILRGDGFTPIAHGLRSDQAGSFRLSSLARTPVGRGRARLEWQTAPWGQDPWTGAIGSGAFFRTGVPDPPDGSSLLLHGQATGLATGARYGWRVRHATRHPNFQRSRWYSPHANGILEFDLRTNGPTGTVDVDPPAAGGALAFAGATPNPFGGAQGAATLRFTLPAPGRVTIDAYDAAGRRVGRVHDVAHASAGPGAAAWDGRDPAGRALPRGLYFVRLRFAGEERTAKVVISD